MTVSAKVMVTSLTVEEDKDGSPARARVGFSPDYADGRNKAWADATPSLSLNMTLNGAVANSFVLGQRYTLTFNETVEEPEPVIAQPTTNPFEHVKTEEEVKEDQQEAVDDNEAAKKQWDDDADDSATQAMPAETPEQEAAEVEAERKAAADRAAGITPA